MERTGDRDLSIGAELERFGKDIKWANEHESELLAQYPDQWVGVLDEVVVGNSPDFDKFLEDMVQKGILDKVFVRHLFTDPPVFILSAA